MACFVIKTMTAILVILCLVHASPIIVDGKYSLDSSFHPILDQQECNNYYTNNQYVCDPSNYFTYPEKQKLGEIMQQSQKYPIISCPFGADGIQFAVFIISSFNDYHSARRDQGDSVAEASKFYAKLYHEKWQIGNEECNNGVVIFLSVRDRYLYISTSTYIKAHYISDHFVDHELMPQIRSYLKSQQYSEAIMKIIEIITDKCQQQLLEQVDSESDSPTSAQHEQPHHHYYSATTSNHSYSALTYFLTITIGIVLLLWLLGLMNCTHCCCCCCRWLYWLVWPKRDSNRHQDRNERPEPYANSNRRRNQRQDNYNQNDYHNNNNGNNYNYNHNPYADEGVPFNQPGGNGNEGNIHRMNAQIPTNPSPYLRSRNVQNAQPAAGIVRGGGGAGLSFAGHQHGADNIRRERERKQQMERERREREERIKQQNLKNEIHKNEQLVKNAKRTQYGGGSGLSWDDDQSNKDNAKRRTNSDDGGGGSW